MLAHRQATNRHDQECSLAKWRDKILHMHLRDEGTPYNESLPRRSLLSEGLSRDKNHLGSWALQSLATRRPIDLKYNTKYASLPRYFRQKIGEECLEVFALMGPSW